MYNPPKGSSGHKGFSHIYAAAKHANIGNMEKAKAHVSSAHQHVGDHVKELTTSGKHTEAKEFNAQAQDMLMRLDDLMKHKGKFTKSEVLGKGPSMDAQKKRWQTNREASPNEVQHINHNPGQDGRYDYKPYSALASHDQLRASHAFAEKDMHSYEYPHDKKTGEMVHGTRWKSPAQQAPRASNPEMAGRVAGQATAVAPRANENVTANSMAATGKIAPQHKAGAGIRIQAEGHEYHGKLGIVQGPNPSMPGKIPVQIHHKGLLQNVFMEPHQVKLSKLASIQKAENLTAAGTIVLLHKSKSALDILRKKG